MFFICLDILCFAIYIYPIKTPPCCGLTPESGTDKKIILLTFQMA